MKTTEQLLNHIWNGWSLLKMLEKKMMMKVIRWFYECFFFQFTTLEIFWFHEFFPRKKMNLMLAFLKSKELALYWDKVKIKFPIWLLIKEVGLWLVMERAITALKYFWFAQKKKLKKDSRKESKKKDEKIMALLSRLVRILPLKSEFKKIYRIDYYLIYFLLFPPV